MKFRKKPIVIEAVQWFKNGDHPLDYAEDRPGFHRDEASRELSTIVITGAHAKAHDWEGQIVRYFRRPDVDGETPCRHCDVRMHDHGWIDTLEGGHIVCPGDWVITGVKGEHYPCKHDIFDATYELAYRPTGFRLYADQLARVLDSGTGICATCGHAFSDHNGVTGLGECYAPSSTGGLCQCPKYVAEAVRPAQGEETK